MGQVITTSQDYYRYLKTGMKLSLSIDGCSEVKGLSVALIGYKIDQFLVVDMLGVDDELIESLHGQALVVRGLTDSSYGHVIAFKCKWLALSEVLCKQLYLSIPDKIIAKPIREHSRYKLDLVCNVSFGKSSIDGAIVDFSVSGCGVYTEQPHDYCKGLKVKIESELNRFLPSTIMFEVVSVKKHARGSLIGIQFDQQVLMSNALKNALAEMSLQAT
ncbi:hypothetical protein BCU70_07455 [Vibrio sp. 10N.286.49.C2]|uniref:PilZ domain-containing protein n=1 Tax=unclassified Vibrio TaxID=2614977 RepID=UPI000C860872|nr:MULTISPECIES: PilZ domain-containing protein [unclassified Vibrio]PMH29478.1 hypothetical protein BCU70_07455 [Vibrio sp. 10N.286.49.C2]PMH55993.1 hypothetical protein BCU66_07365 [Vibrio sp. 10N.286.49.B1]PMH77751.1 hypothetical protein BCU58_11945 [Vibrio sp. 10N.286.48.B7]